MDLEKTGGLCSLQPQPRAATAHTFYVTIMMKTAYLSLGNGNRVGVTESCDVDSHVSGTAQARSRNYNHWPTFCSWQFMSIFIQIFLVDSEKKLFYFCKSDGSAVQGHPRSLFWVPMESAYATSYYFIISLVISCTILEILQVFVLMTHPYSTLILGALLLQQIAHGQSGAYTTS